MFQPSRTECMNVCLGHEEVYNSKHMDMNPIWWDCITCIQYLVYLSNCIATGYKIYK